MVFVWLALMVLFLIMEANTVVVVSAWFAAGSLAAMIAALLGAQLWVQIVIFLAVSIIFLASLRPLVRKYFKPKLVKTNIDAIVGTQGHVTAEIHNTNATGQVKLGGMEWSARSTSGEPIPAGTLIRVDRVEGVKVFVTPVTETAEV